MSLSYNSLARKKYLILLAIIIVISILLRLPSINSGFSQVDELNDVYNALNIASIPSFEWIDPRNYSNIAFHGPLYAFLIAFIANILFLPVLLFLNIPIPLNNDILHWEHTSGVYIIEPLFRTVSVIFGIIAIFLVFKLGKEFNYATGLTAAFILGVSSWHIYTTYYISPHGALSMITILSLFLFYKGLKEENNRLIIYALVVAGLGVYMNMLAILIPIIFLIYTFIYYRKSISTFNSGIKAYLVVVLFPTLTFIATGGKWFLAQIKGSFLGAAIPPYNDWMILWDPARGAFPSKTYPFLYLNIFLDYLSPVVLILLVTGVVYSALQAIRNKNKLDTLMLIYFIIPLIALNLLTAKTPRYPAIILPAIAILSARALVWFANISAKIWKNFRYPTIYGILILILISQPHLNNFINEKYVIVSKGGGVVYDPLIIADYINPRITQNDTGFGGTAMIPWWYIRGDSIPDLDLDYSLNKTPPENPKFIIIEQYKRDIQGTGGGPVWLETDYGRGKIKLVSFNVSKNWDYLKKLISEKSAIAIMSSEDLSKELSELNFNFRNIDPENLNAMSNYDTLILYKTSESERNLLNKNNYIINSFLENGGNILVINPDIRYIDFLPIKTKVATQVNKYPGHYDPIPQDKIFFSENVSEDINWTGFFFDYDRRYREIAFSSPVGLFLYENYNLASVIRDPPTGWPLVEIWGRK